MKTQTSWTMGNFTVSLKAELNEQATAKAVEKGLLWAGQRKSGLDDTLSGVDAKKRKAQGFKRDSVAYSQAMAERLKALFSTVELDDNVVVETEVTVGEYVPTTADSKFVKETEVMSRHESKGDLEEWLKSTVGYSGDTHGEDGEYSKEALGAIRAYAKRLLDSI